MAAFAVQNFVSAAVGIAVAIAMVRGFARHSAKTIGNFWVDVTRCTVYLLIPVCILATVFFVSQGAIQNFKAPATATTLEGASQVIEQGSAGVAGIHKDAGDERRRNLQRELCPSLRKSHPVVEHDPDAACCFSLGAGLTYTFGKMVGDTRQGWALFAAMAVMSVAGVVVCYTAEQTGNPILSKMGVEHHYTGTQPGGNMEGKEVRFGNAATTLVRHGNHGCQLWGRQQHARQLHAARWTGTAV